MKSTPASAFGHLPDSYIPGKSRFAALDIEDEKALSEISSMP
jgi:hypothetical protein